MKSWSRKELKTSAKSMLKGRYWLAFLVSFIASVLISGSILSTRVIGWKIDGRDFGNRIEQESGKIEEAIREFLSSAYADRILPVIGAVAVIVILAALVLGVLALLAMVAYSVFISNPVIVGQKKFYIDSRKGSADAGKLLSSFGNGYRNIVRVMFIKHLRVILWTLLFVIPGIIKAIEYFAVDYLLAEYPGMETDRALKLSSEMTRGQKWGIFKLALSFTGWILLCLVTGGIGFVFLAPYVEATFAELYAALSIVPSAESLDEPEEVPAG